MTTAKLHNQLVHVEKAFVDARTFIDAISGGYIHGNDSKDKPKNVMNKNKPTAAPLAFSLFSLTKHANVIVNETAWPVAPNKNSLRLPSI